MHLHSHEEGSTKPRAENVSCLEGSQIRHIWSGEGWPEITVQEQAYSFTSFLASRSASNIMTMLAKDLYHVVRMPSLAMQMQSLSQLFVVFSSILRFYRKTTNKTKNYCTMVREKGSHSYTEENSILHKALGWNIYHTLEHFSRNVVKKINNTVTHPLTHFICGWELECRCWQYEK